MKRLLTILLFFSLTTNAQVIGWGDSMTEYPVGQSYTTWLSKFIGQVVYNKGIAGNTSTQIMNRHIQSPETFSLTTIIWSGTNNYSQKATIIQDIQRQVDSLTGNYIIIPIFNGTAELLGSVGYNKIIAANDSIRIHFAGHVFDMLNWMLSLPALTAQDSIDKINKVICQSYRGDNLHLNVFGSYFLAIGLLDSCSSILVSTAQTYGNLRTVNNIGNNVLDLETKGDYSPGSFEMLTGVLSGANWVNVGDTYQHTPGSTAALTKSIPGCFLNTYYQVEFDVSAATAGTLLAKFGNDTVWHFASIPSTGRYKKLIKAPSTGTFVLSFTPTSVFNGIISNPTVTMTRTDNEPQLAISDNDNNILFQLRTYRGNSWALGWNSMKYNKSNLYSFGLTDYSLPNLANGIGITGAGWKTGSELINGTYISMYGYQQLLKAKNSTYLASGGVSNFLVATNPSYSAVWAVRGYEKLINGWGNAGIGYSIGLNLLNGNYNFFAGYLAGSNITSGNNNIAIGNNAKLLSVAGNNQISINNFLFKGTGLNFTINGTGTDSLPGGQDQSANFEVRGTLGTSISGGTTAQMYAITNPSPLLLFKNTEVGKIAIFITGIGWKYLSIEP